MKFWRFVLTCLVIDRLGDLCHIIKLIGDNSQQTHHFCVHPIWQWQVPYGELAGAPFLSIHPSALHQQRMGAADRMVQPHGRPGPCAVRHARGLLAACVRARTRTRMQSVPSLCWCWSVVERRQWAACSSARSFTRRARSRCSPAARRSGTSR